MTNEMEATVQAKANDAARAFKWQGVVNRLRTSTNAFRLGYIAGAKAMFTLLNKTKVAEQSSAANLDKIMKERDQLEAQLLEVLEFYGKSSNYDPFRLISHPSQPWTTEVAVDSGKRARAVLKNHQAKMKKNQRLALKVKSST